jgi:hypothetical protein
MRNGIKMLHRYPPLGCLNWICLFSTSYEGIIPVMLLIPFGLDASECFQSLSEGIVLLKWKMPGLGRAFIPYFYDSNFGVLVRQIGSVIS